MPPDGEIVSAIFLELKTQSSLKKKSVVSPDFCWDSRSS
jgi:hypothetical protein